MFYFNVFIEVKRSDVLEMVGFFNMCIFIILYGEFENKRVKVFYLRL